LTKAAFADGLFQENLPPANLGNQQASLFVKINPSVLTNDTKPQDAYVQFRLYDLRNNETIKFTTFIITVTMGTDPNAKPVMTEAFTTESGLLTLRIKPQEGPVSVEADKGPVLNTWVESPGKPITISGPLLLKGGLYHFRILLLTANSLENRFGYDAAPIFDSYLSVGDVSKHEIQLQGKTYPITVISYYDKVTDFSFDASSKTYSWAMSFDWDIKRLEASNTNIFVHEEVKVPKSLPGVGDAKAFDARTNGVPATGRMLAVDPFSDPENLVLHFLISKSDLMEMARSNLNTTASHPSQLTFSFSPEAKDVTAATNITEDKSSKEIATDTGGLQVLLNWTPSQLKAGEVSTLRIQFVDPISGAINTSEDVRYDLKVLDRAGSVVLTRTDMTAKGGTDKQELNFPSDDRYGIEVAVKGVVKHDGQSVDLTKNGIARGLVVVPEFPASLSATLALGAAIGVIALMHRISAFERILR
jgi:hypothetical protein